MAESDSSKDNTSNYRKLKRKNSNRNDMPLYGNSHIQGTEDLRSKTEKLRRQKELKRKARIEAGTKLCRLIRQKKYEQVKAFLDR